jgi:hypothetical protein
VLGGQGCASRSQLSSRVRSRSPFALVVRNIVIQQISVEGLWAESAVEVRSCVAKISGSDGGREAKAAIA